MGSPGARVQCAELWAMLCLSWCHKFMVPLMRFPVLLRPGCRWKSTAVSSWCSRVHMCCPYNSLHGPYVGNGELLAHIRAEVGCPSGVSSAFQHLGLAQKETPGPETVSEHCVESLGLNLPFLCWFHPFWGCFASRGFPASCGFQFWVRRSSILPPWTVSPPTAPICSMSRDCVPCLCCLLQA